MDSYAWKQHREKGSYPYYLGYAYEALARAEHVAGNEDEMEKYLDPGAPGGSRTLTDAEEKKMLLKDLATIR